jgi:DICT domain-containing protein
VAIELLSAARCAFHNHMHLDRTNNASKNDCENVNTLAQDDDHLVVLAHLRWQCCLSGREGLGSSLPPVELARRDSGVFEEFK